MAHAIAFDTLAFARKLEEAGRDPKKSEAMVRGIANICGNILNESIFTRQNSQRLKVEIEPKIEALKLDVETKLAKSKNEIMLWVIGLLFTHTTILISIFKFIY